jgi:ribosomal protein L9
LQPQEATDLISELLPPNIDFYRVPIPAEPAKPTEPEPVKRLSPSISAKSAIYAAAAAAEEQSQNAAAQAKAGIYGSVSTSDIAANLKAVLEESSQGSSIVLSHENISFVDQMEDRSRVKQLGLFDIEIKLSGAANAIRRTVTVNAQG